MSKSINALDIKVSILFNLLLARVTVLLCFFFFFFATFNDFSIIPVVREIQELKMHLLILQELQ